MANKTATESKVRGEVGKGDRTAKQEITPDVIDRLFGFDKKQRAEFLTHFKDYGYSNEVAFERDLDIAVEEVARLSGKLPRYVTKSNLRGLKHHRLSKATILRIHFHPEIADNIRLVDSMAEKPLTRSTDDDEEELQCMCDFIMADCYDAVEMAIAKVLGKYGWRENVIEEFSQAFLEDPNEDILWGEGTPSEESLLEKRLKLNKAERWRYHRTWVAKNYT